MKATVTLVALAVLAGCGTSNESMPLSPSPVPAPVPDPDPTASYRVTFEATWSAATHPDMANMFPATPHFSGLIGATHEDGFRLWQAGTIASNGIEAMAELGAKTPFDMEIQQAIDAGRAEHLLSGGGIARSPDAVVLDFDISLDKPSVTLVSMIAPSPDWFVGVSNLSLLENGDWADELVIGLDPYDAGTDSGASYESRDRDTSPRRPIAHITMPPLASNGVVPVVGTFTFRRR